MTLRFVLILTALTPSAVALGAEPAPATRPATSRPAATHEISPVVAAFMRPIEVGTKADGLPQKTKERHNALVQILDLSVQGYRKGTSSASQIFEAARNVGESNMALAQTADERNSAAQQLIDVAKEIESRAEKQLKSGFGSEIDLQR